jgi:type II secretory pathway pseudopilin PulG
VRFNKTLGLTLVEILVALLLLSTVALVAGGFVLPLRLSADSQRETQAVTLARSYLELVKVRWLNSGNFGSSPSWGLPTVSSTATNVDIELPANWTLTVASGFGTTPTPWTTTDTLRTIVVTVRPAGNASKPVVLSTLIARP